MNRWLVIARTVVIALVGVAVAIVINLPMPWLLGALFGCLIAAFLGLDLKAHAPTGAAMRTILGVAVGASITPELVGRLPEMALSLSLIPPMILVIALVGIPYFRRVWRYDPVTSYYAAMPGGLQDMLVFGEEAGGNVRVLSLIHATRVLLIVSLLPFFLTIWMGIDLSNPPGAPISEFDPVEGIIMVLLAVVGWKGAEAVGLFGATILGPLILTAIAALTGLIHSRPPAEAVQAAQFFIGLTLGVKYVGITMKEFRETVVAGIGFGLVLAVLSVIFMEIVYQLGIAPALEAILAFAPGGQGELVVVAIVAGADLAYVVTHHLLRIVTVIIGAPIASRFMKDDVP